MKPVKILCAFGLMALITLWAPRANGQAGGQPVADTIVVNAKIYTVNARQPWAEALATRGDKIIAVGTRKEIEAYRGAATRVIDAQDHLVFPGFVDCHVHFMGGSVGLSQVLLDGANTVAEIQKRVKDFAAAHPGAPWIRGSGWLYTTFGDAALPDKKILDEVVPDRPVLLSAYDGHTVWGNSKALQLAGITRDTPDPPNGVIVHDPKTGEPTGALKEEAGRFAARVAPEPTRQERLAALRQGFHEANRVGVVRVHGMGGDAEYLDLYDELRQKGQLTVRLYTSVVAQPPDLTAEQIDNMEKVRRTYHDDWISGGGVKFRFDGVIEAHTAAMLQPYTDDPSQSGFLKWKEEKYKQAVAELDRHGFQIFTHAIGDRAIRVALDAYENAAKVNGTKDARHRIEHIEDSSAADIPRFGSLGVIASMQPLHAYPNDNILKVWARNVGPERAQRAWAWHSIAVGGGRLAFGSDWPVVTINPWPGVQNLLTRQTTEGNPPGGWVPQMRITLPEAIEGYTLGAAIAGHREKSEGSLEVGKLADLIIVSQDLFHIEPSQIGQTKVLLTMVGGKVVHESAALEPVAPARGR
jgi:predicted amidohydrolase YtcJ